MPGTNPEANTGAPDPAHAQTRLLKTLARATIALALGVTIAWVDSRPGWDDTGVTAGLLVLAAALVVMIGSDVTAATIAIALPVAATQPMNSFGFWLIFLFALIGAGLTAFSKRVLRTR